MNLGCAKQLRTRTMLPDKETRGKRSAKNNSKPKRRIASVLNRVRNLTKIVVRNEKKQADANVIISALKSDLNDCKRQLVAAVAGRQAQAKSKSLLQGKCCTLTNCNNLLAKKKIRANLKIAQDEGKRLTYCLEDSHGQQNIATMTGPPSKYTDAVRHSGIQLLVHNVGIDHISPVIICDTYLDTVQSRSSAQLRNMV